ncbi:MAG TPA: hypothetical protein VLT33_48940 [Labilithrix sp.]|nr:hypothetical protein [Labilithrix sp.]
MKLPDGVGDTTTVLRRVGEQAEIAEIRRLYACGEVDAAMDLAGRVRSSASVPADAVPIVIVNAETLKLLPLDHRSGFILARVDGISTIRSIVDTAAMPLEEVLDILDKLFTVGALALAAPDDEPTIPRPTVAAPRTEDLEDTTIDDDEPTERRGPFRA